LSAAELSEAPTGNRRARDRRAAFRERRHRGIKPATELFGKLHDHTLLKLQTNDCFGAAHFKVIMSGQLLMKLPIEFAVAAHSTWGWRGLDTN
jgi:hypothetical protein